MSSRRTHPPAAFALRRPLVCVCSGALLVSLYFFQQGSDCVSLVNVHSFILFLYLAVGVLDIRTYVVCLFSYFTLAADGNIVAQCHHTSTVVVSRFLCRFNSVVEHDVATMAFNTSYICCGLIDLVSLADVPVYNTSSAL